jgi:hypothetical protein
MSTRIEVVQTGRKIVWPPMCACCGEEAETNIEIEYKRPQPSADQVFHHHVPACTICSIHSVPKKTGIWVLIFSVLLVPGFLFMGFVISLELDKARTFVGLTFSIVWLAADVFLLVRLLQMDARRKAREVMKPTCSAKIFVAFYVSVPFGFFKAPPPSHIFLFANDSYARDFAELNHGVESGPKKR